MARSSASAAAAPPARLSGTSPAAEPDAEASDERGQRAVQSVEVGGRLLLALAAQPGPMTLKDLAAAAGLPASRAHPYLVSFGRLKLIEQQADTGRYALGPAALQLGLACLQQLDALQAAGPVAQALAADTGCAVALAVWGNLGPTVVRMLEARAPLHVAMRAGTVMSVLGTATGRAFAAVLPEARILRLAAAVGMGLADGPGGSGLELAAPLGAGSQPDALPAVRAALAAAQAEWQAHSLTRAAGRPIPGVNAFSAPAFDHEGQPAIVITALGHQDHVPTDWNSVLAGQVRQAAAEISARLGGRARP